MLQGHIDFVDRGRVEGWIHSDRTPLTGAAVLALVGEDCVGSGRIDVYREDLARVGMADGVVGFGFSIFLEPWQDHRVLTVQVEGSNAFIKQRAARITAQDEDNIRNGPLGNDLQRLSWMLSRGWLRQKEFDALRLLSLLGAYSLRLDLRGLENSSGECRRRVATAGRELIQLCMFRAVDLRMIESRRHIDLSRLRRDLSRQFFGCVSIIGLWSPGTNTLTVVEGSHVRPWMTGASGVDYEFGSDRLLLLDLNTAASFPVGGTSAPVSILIPTILDRGSGADAVQ